MRWEILKKFQAEISDCYGSISSCAIVGGTSQDPEVRFLQAQSIPTLKKDFSYLGIEETATNFVYLDLNILTNLNETWDLVLCSQVLEHVWNHENFFGNLGGITSVGGLLWISVPMSNIVHGSPDYFSAGFAPEYLVKNLQQKNFKVLSSGSIGSRRNYLSTHLLGRWLTELEHDSPILGHSHYPAIRIGEFRKLVREVIQGFLLVFSSNKVNDNPRYATESYVLAVRVA
jgi:SAM-dependent methyltransferase